jgi:hypothetical protein
LPLKLSTNLIWWDVFLKIFFINYCSFNSFFFLYTLFAEHLWWIWRLCQRVGIQPPYILLW